MNRFEAAIQAIDAANGEDPRRVECDGRDHPAELLYGRRMSATLASFAPEASEILRLAVRAQHIRRWTVPRESYPRDRTGYLRWRTDLKRMHAETAAEILARCGYAEAEQARVRFLVEKRNLKTDPETQILEDVACLVFLRHQAEDFASGHDDEKVRDILSKTWKKMSASGRQAALALDLPPRLRTLIDEVVSSGD